MLLLFVTAIFCLMLRMARLIFFFSSDAINMWVSLFLSYPPSRCLLSLGCVVVVASLVLYIRCSRPIALFYGLLLCQINEDHRISLGDWRM